MAKRDPSGEAAPPRKLAREQRKAVRSERRATQKRTRRTPEESVTLILDAADRVFARHLPDAVGLKQIAKEAGVSHALVTHYFGTYDALVEQTLSRRTLRLREGFIADLMRVASEDGGTVELLAAHRKALARVARDPATMRLVVWALLSGRANQAEFFPSRLRGLELLADALTHRTTPPVEREDLELAIMTSLSLGLLWALARQSVLGSFGRPTGPEADADFDARVGRMLDAFLTSSAKRLTRKRT
jgi:TetR/AcrR family transcriptional regulator, repressor for neighboring sulfatase